MRDVRDDDRIEELFDDVIGVLGQVKRCVGPKTRKVLAAVVKMPQHKITVKVRRAGGAFGGKLVRHAPVAAAAAVGALKHGE